jgi:hypothetical protein
VEGRSPMASKLVKLGFYLKWESGGGDPTSA